MTEHSATPGTPQTTNKAIVAGVVAMILVYLTDNGFTVTDDVMDIIEVVVSGVLTFGLTWVAKNKSKVDPTHNTGNTGTTGSKGI